MHVTAQKGAKHPKRFRGKPWPSVATAYEALVEDDRIKLAEANRAFAAMFEVVPAAEFEADLAEHRADLEAGAELTGPQRRALEGAQAQRREPSSDVTRGGLGVLPPAVTKPVPAGVAFPFRS